MGGGGIEEGMGGWDRGGEGRLDELGWERRTEGVAGERVEGLVWLGTNGFARRRVGRGGLVALLGGLAW